MLRRSNYNNNKNFANVFRIFVCSSSLITCNVRSLKFAGSKVKAMITLGKQGLCLFDDLKRAGPTEAWDRKLRAAYLPAFSGHAVDPLGCGDALLACASLILAAGGSPQAAAYLGSLAAGFEVQQLGNEPITIDALMNCLDLQTRPVPVRLAS